MQRRIIFPILISVLFFVACQRQVDILSGQVKITTLANGNTGEISNTPDDCVKDETDTLEKTGFTEYVTKYSDDEIKAIQSIKVVLSFAGDCTLGTDESFPYINSLPEMLERQNNDYSYFFSGVRHIFEEDDLTLVNLENALTEATDKADKTFRFKGDPDYVNILKTGSIELVNVSNNHTYDYLQKGFDDTLESLKGAGILYSGSGHVAKFKVKGLTIASIGYYGWSVYIKESLGADIERVRQDAHIVVVSFHWGVERAFYPDAAQVELGRFSIDAGADIVIGHHPHVLQGIELYKGRYIVYSLGNFCFGGNCNPDDKDTMIFQSELTFVDNKLCESVGKIIPCSISSAGYINDYKPTVLEGNESQRVLERIYSYSSTLEYGIEAGQ